MANTNYEELPLVCEIATIGEKGVHYPWRVCSRCYGNVETIPEKCPHCGAEVWGFVDMYIRHKHIVLD